MDAPALLKKAQEDALRCQADLRRLRNKETQLQEERVRLQTQMQDQQDQRTVDAQAAEKAKTTTGNTAVHDEVNAKVSMMNLERSHEQQEAGKPSQQLVPLTEQELGYMHREPKQEMLQGMQAPCAEIPTGSPFELPDVGLGSDNQVWILNDAGKGQKYLMFHHQTQSNDSLQGTQLHSKSNLADTKRLSEENAQLLAQVHELESWVEYSALHEGLVNQVGSSMPHTGLKHKRHLGRNIFQEQARHQKEGCAHDSMQENEIEGTTCLQNELVFLQQALHESRQAAAPMADACEELQYALLSQQAAYRDLEEHHQITFQKLRNEHAVLSGQLAEARQQIATAKEMEYTAQQGEKLAKMMQLQLHGDFKAADFNACLRWSRQVAMLESELVQARVQAANASAELAEIHLMGTEWMRAETQRSCSLHLPDVQVASSSGRQLGPGEQLHSSLSPTSNSPMEKQPSRMLITDSFKPKHSEWLQDYRRRWNRDRNHR